jgi:methyl-accepting chemotaxis protein
MFFKLFLGFWLTVILGGAVSVVVISTFQHFSIEVMKTDMSRRFDEHLSKLIVLSGQAAWVMYRSGGKREYESYINGLSEDAGTRISLIGKDNRTVAGEKVGDDIIDLAEAARRNPAGFIKKSGETLIVVKNLAPIVGASVIVVGVHTLHPPPGMPPPPLDGPKPPFLEGVFPPFFGPGEMVRTAIMLIVVSSVCYLLARSLTRPINKLRETTQQIALGDYSIRVGNSLGRAGSEITDLGRDFDTMVDCTEKTINAQKRLLRDISHELRSPLARLNVALELAKKHLAAENDNSLNKIGKEGQRLNELIGQLLTLTKLESGGGIQTVQAVNIGDLLQEVVEDVDFEARGRERGVEIVSSCRGDKLTQCS